MELRIRNKSNTRGNSHSSLIPNSLFLILLLSLFTTTYSLQPFAAHADNTGLVGYWSFNEGAGTVAGDSSGNRYAGTLGSGVSWTNGKRGYGVTDDGSGVVTIGGTTGVADNLASMSVSIWFNTANNDMLLFSKGLNVFNNDPGWYVRVKSAGAMEFRVRDAVTSATQDTGFAVSDGKWHHFVGTYTSGGGGTVAVYLDGQLISSAAALGVPTYSNAENIRIGAQGGGQNFTGTFDEARVYSRVLGTAEIAALYKSGLSIQKPANNLGLVGYWSFDDATSTTATDFSGYRHTGTLIGASGLPTWVNGKRQKALSFSGTDDYVSVGSVGTGIKTVAFWMKRVDSTGGDSIMRISNFQEIEIAAGVGGALSATSFPGTTAIYVDGVSASTLPNNTGWHLVVVTDTTGVDANQIEFGRAGKIYEGMLDEVRVYNRVLSDAEIQALYRMGAAKFSTKSSVLQQGTTLANGLVGHWTFDGGDTTWTSASAGTTRDGSGYNRTGTMTAMSRDSVGAQGKLGQAFNFDGTDDYVDVGDVGTPDPASIAFWINADDTTSRDVLYVGASSKIELDASSVVTATGFASPVVYVDGSSASAVLGSGWHHVYISFTNGLPPPFMTSLQFGQGGGASFFDGKLDDIRLYSRVLSAAEVKQLYLLGGVKAR